MCRTKQKKNNWQISTVINERREKRYDIPIDFSSTCISLNVKFSIPKKNSRIFLTFFTFLD